MKIEKGKSMIPKRSELLRLYGPIESLTWPDESKHMLALHVDPIFFNWKNTATGKPTTSIYCNKDIVQPLTHALNDVYGLDVLDLLKTFDGCFNIRPQRGYPDALSAHAYGLAIDINAATNKLGEVGDMDPRIVSCFRNAGFIWGGDWKRPDPQHFQYLLEE